MVAIPDEDTLVGIFHNITNTMLGMDAKRSAQVATLQQQKDLLYCTGVLPMPGPTPITVAVSSDLQGSSQLASALFAVEPTDVEIDMVSDTMAELSNMFAGQLKGFLNLSQNLGLPKVFTKGEFEDALADTRWKHIPVDAGGARVLVSFTTEPAIVGLYLA
jgi:CheY-specific phosphatase CheX